MDVDVCVDVSAEVGVGVGLELLSVSLHYGLTGGGSKNSRVYVWLIF